MTWTCSRPSPPLPPTHPSATLSSHTRLRGRAGQGCTTRPAMRSTGLHRQLGEQSQQRQSDPGQWAACAYRISDIAAGTAGAEAGESCTLCCLLPRPYQGGIHACTHGLQRMHMGRHSRYSRHMSKLHQSSCGPGRPFRSTHACMHEAHTPLPTQVRAIRPARP